MTKFFTVEQVIEIHDAFLEDHGGLPGIRDKGLLISAVEIPRTSMFGEYLHKTIYDKASYELLSRLCKIMLLAPAFALANLLANPLICLIIVRAGVMSRM